MTRETAARLPRARKSLGQHFLVSERAATRIVDALGDVAGCSLVEIGPGRGILTAILLRRGARVLGVELDRDLAAYLRSRFGERAGLEVVQGDVLKLDLGGLARDHGLDLPLQVVGNIPYKITSPFLRKLLATPDQLGRAVLMLQREVVERLLAKPGTGAYGSLTVGVGAVVDVELVLTLGPSKFRPPPQVWSAVVRLEPRSAGLEARERALLEELTKTVFSGRRKQLQKVLRQSGLAGRGDLDELETRLGVPLTARPEELPVEGYVALLRFLEARGYGSPTFPHTR